MAKKQHFIRKIREPVDVLVEAGLMEHDKPGENCVCKNERAGKL